MQQDIIHLLLNQIFYKFLKDLNIKIERNNRTILDGKEIDFLLSDYNIGIEFNGCLWHSTFSNKDKKYHYNKRILAQNKNIDLYTVWEDDWNYKQNIIKSIIKSKLNIFDYIINSNNCKCISISHNEVNNFLEINDIQGPCTTYYNYGLYYNNELVSVIIFKKSKIKETFEIIRYCNKLNYNIINSLYTFIKYFLENCLVNIENIIYYINADLNNGNICYQTGMQLQNTKIDYLWLQNGKRIIKPIDKKYKCYNSGKLKFMLKIDEDKIL